MRSAEGVCWGQRRRRRRAVWCGSLILSWAVLACAPLHAACCDEAQCDREAMALGLQVQAIVRAIREPDRDGAMADVVALGTDSRYYAMVRGWLALELQGASSMLRADGEGENAAIKARVDFLQRAIRAIDLE